jgi:hypothetical protein
MRGKMHFAAGAVPVVLLGLLLLAGTAAANQAWFDHHFLPVFFLTRAQYVLGETLARLFVAALGVILLLLARPAGRLVERRPGRTLAIDALGIAIAIGLALGVSELVLRHTFALATAQGPVGEEPLSQPDAKLGWVFVPSRTGHARVAGHDITYVIGPHGYRTGGVPVDPARPAILITGESIMAGFGLNWDESIAGRLAARTGIQSADMAVFGYANDQAYLRLAAELPRFRKPVAVISLFIPSLFVRNLDDDRPHLDQRLAWQPAIHRWRIVALAKFLFPYHSSAAIERGIAETRAALMATAKLARAHGATPFILVPEFAPETPMERTLRRRILDQAHLAYLMVPLDPAWRIKGDLHPDARAARAIADAIAARLKLP